MGVGAALGGGVPGAGKSRGGDRGQEARSNFYQRGLARNMGIAK